MYQVVVSYLDSRYGCFFSDDVILDYDELLEKVKTAVPYIYKIRIAYKDINLSSSLSSTGARQEEGVL